MGWWQKGWGVSGNTETFSKAEMWRFVDKLVIGEKKTDPTRETEVAWLRV